MLEQLEERRLLSVAQTWVNDSWAFALDSDGSGSLTVGDLVSDPLLASGANPGGVRTYGQNAFGTITSGNIGATDFSVTPATISGKATINDAIGETNNNGTVSILTGTYEENVTVDASRSGLSLIGTDKSNTIIEGQGGFTLSITGANTSIQGLQITNSDSSSSAGVVIGYQAAGSSVTDSKISGNLTGVYLASGVTNVSVDHNQITGNAGGRS